MKGLKSVTASRGRFLSRGQEKVGCKALKSLLVCSAAAIESLKQFKGHPEYLEILQGVPARSHFFATRPLHSSPLLLCYQKTKWSSPNYSVVDVNVSDVKNCSQKKGMPMYRGAEILFFIIFKRH